jgi:hypothetical protein
MRKGAELMKRMIGLYVLLLSLIPGACEYESKLFGMTSARVISIKPADGSAGVDPSSPITVVFNRSMDTVKTSSEFELHSSDGKADGYFYWSNDDTTMEFRPSKRLLGARKYSINVRKGSEDREGNDLDEDYSSCFCIDSDLISPTVISYRPGNAQIGVLPDQFIEIEFSEPININSVYDGVVTSPVIDGRYDWLNHDTTLRIIPYTPLKKGSTYYLTLNKNITDRVGNPLGDELTYSFVIGSDFIAPVIAETRQTGSDIIFTEDRTIEGIEKRGDLKILFDDSIDPGSIADCITFTPAAAYYLTTLTDGPSSVMTIHLLDDLELEAQYQMVIAKTLTDLNGNALDHVYRYHFRVNGTHSQRPLVLFMTDADRWHMSSGILPVSGEYWLHGQVQPFTTASSTLSGIYIIFNRTMQPSTINVDIQAEFGKPSPRLDLPNWYSFNDQPYRIYKFDMVGISSVSTIKITVKGGAEGVLDADGNWMKEDYIQYIRY